MRSRKERVAGFLPLWASVIIGIAVFSIDLWINSFSELPVETRLLYLLAILPSLKIGRPRQVVASGALCSVLTVLGHWSIAGTFDSFLPGLFINSVLVLLAIWIVALGIYRYRILRMDSVVEELRETKARLLRSVAGTHDGLWEFNAMTNESWTSPRFNQIIGYTDQEMGSYRPEYWYKMIHVEDQERARQALRDHVKKGHRFDLEFKIRKKDGTYRDVHVKGKSSRDKDGRSVFMSGSMSDVSERTLALKKLEKTNRELEQFVHAASHDLKGPLRHISGYSGMLLSNVNERTNRDTLRMLSRMDLAAKRMHDLIEALLQYSKLRHEQIELSEIDLRKVIEDAISNLADEIGTSNTEIRIGTMPKVLGNRALLLQLFRNLIGNSIKFRKSSTSAHNLIQFSQEHLEDRIEIRVQDNGIGFSSEYSERIFRIFSRLHSSERYSGTGIGLALCRQIMSLHRGEIKAESEEGRGAVFLMTFPVPPAQTSPGLKREPTRTKPESASKSTKATQPS